MESTSKKHLSRGRKPSIRLKVILLCIYGVFTVQGCELDLAFALDESGSISSSEFSHSKQFSADLVNGLQIGANEVRVAAVTFASDTQLQFGFNFNVHTTKASVMTALQNIPWRSGRTNTHLALNYMADTLFTPKTGSRQTSSKVAIVLTDGQSFSKSKTLTAAQHLRRTGVSVFAIGIGSGVDHAELLNIAGDKSRVFTIPDFYALKSVKAHHDVKTCTLQLIVVNIPSTPTSKISISEQSSEQSIGSRSAAIIGVSVTAGVLSMAGLTALLYFKVFKVLKVAEVMPQNAGNQLEAWTTGGPVTASHAPLGHAGMINK